MTNRFKIPFNLPDLSGIDDTYAIEREWAEHKMRAWCQERIGYTEDVPFWQFGSGHVHVWDTQQSDDIGGVLIIHQCIFIWEDEDRVAFKLAFGL